MTLDLDHPGQRALLALQLAGFEAARLPAWLLDHPAQDSFEVHWQRPGPGQVVLAYDAAAARFEIEESLGTALPAERDALALQLNATLEPHQRIGQRAERDCLQVSSFVPLAQADVATLAAELTAVAALVRTLEQARPANPQPDPPDLSAQWGLRA